MERCDNDNNNRSSGASFSADRTKAGTTKPGLFGTDSEKKYDADLFSETFDLLCLLEHLSCVLLYALLDSIMSADCCNAL